MLNMSGKQLLRQIKEGYPQVAEKVVFIARDTVSRDTGAFLRRSGCSHPMKPFGLDDIRRLVTEKGRISLQDPVGQIAVVLASHGGQGGEYLLSMRVAFGKGRSSSLLIPPNR